ncbi:MULE domain-containing protein [Trichonephila clavipes]|nr:MULE domain-containing protein [Trichonephila clavipes]
MIREGFPAAFILSNRQDSTVLTLAFAAIKKHTCISPRVLMTDDSEYFFNAWKPVFGIPEKRLLCTWHVDRSWRRSISRLITKKEIQVEAYKTVRSLLVETDEAAFDIMLIEALKMFDEKEEMKGFKRYFEQTYNGQNISAEGLRPPLMEELPCLRRFDWSRPINAESGRGKELGRSENKRPETRRSWNLN